MLDYNSFKGEFVSSCRERLAAGSHSFTGGCITIEEKTVTKAQYGDLTGLIFRADGSNCAPTVYVEDFYRSYRNGCSVEELSIAAVNSMMHYAASPPAFFEDALKDTANLRVRLLNISRNSLFLRDVPYIDTGCGLALIAEIVSGEYRAVVTDEILASYEMSRDELFEAAFENSLSDEPPVLFALTDMLSNGSESCVDYLEDSSRRFLPPAEALFLLSNRSCFRGAAALFYPGITARLNELMGGAFYVLPSSIHELLLLPLSEGDPQKLAEIIGSANRTVVNDADYLSDDLYICEDGNIRRAGISSMSAEPRSLPS